MIRSIPLELLGTTAHGVARPEDVKVTRAGRVLVSDAAAAVSEILPDGGLRRIGKAGGEPNGLAPMPDGSIVIANFASAVLQRLDPVSGSIEVLLDEVDGQPLGAVNYPVADRHGAIWVSSSTRSDPVATIASGEEDGFVFRVDPDGSATVVADAVAWPNCMTFDDDERYLYACRSSRCDVVRFEVIGTGRDRTLGLAQRYGPQLGDRRPDEFGPEQVAAFGQPDVLARWGLTDGCAFDAEGNLWVTLHEREPHRGDHRRPRGRDRRRRPGRRPGGVAHQHRLRRARPAAALRRLPRRRPRRHRSQPRPRPPTSLLGDARRLSPETAVPKQALDKQPLGR